MAISIDTVYQKVLAIANKEQRGYITPQEFNLFANQAQLDIFEQYFYDLNQFSRMKGNSTEYADMVDLLNEKISRFTSVDPVLYSTAHNVFSLPGTLYRLGTVMYKGKEVEEVQDNDLLYLNMSPLAKPSENRPVYVQRDNGLAVFPDSITDEVKISWIRKPDPVEWGYIVVGGKAMYEPGRSFNFLLHQTEETELVIQILKLAGIQMENELYQIASQEESKGIQQEKQ